MFPILAKKSPAASESFQHFKAGLLELEEPEKSKSVYYKMLKIIFMMKLNLVKNHFLLVVFSIFILASLSLFAGAIPGVRCKQSLSSWMVEICNKF